MSFTQNAKGTGYAPGYFLAHEECVRETREFATSGATTADNGAKYWPMGKIWPTADASAEGIVYEDVDVSSGNMPGSLVTKGDVVEDRLPQATPTYSEASVTAADDPTTEGWYEKDGDTYALSADTIAQKGKKYYESDGQAEPTYTEVTDIEYGDNPKALGLYESDGAATPTYTLSEDTQADGSKTYYTYDGKILGSTVKNALKALGFKFVTESKISRPY